MLEIALKMIKAASKTHFIKSHCLRVVSKVPSQGCFPSGCCCCRDGALAIIATEYVINCVEVQVWKYHKGMAVVVHKNDEMITFLRVGMNDGWAMVER